MARTASWYDSSELAEDWPTPRHERLRPAPAGPAPRRGFRDHAALVLALLGLATAAAAAAWYVHLRPAPPRVLTVPRVVGLGEGPAVRALTNEGFRVRAVEEELSSSGRAIVTTQRPQARTRLARGATVTIHVVRRPARTLAGHYW